MDESLPHNDATTISRRELLGGVKKVASGLVATELVSKLPSNAPAKEYQPRRDSFDLFSLIRRVFARRPQESTVSPELERDTGVTILDFFDLDQVKPAIVAEVLGPEFDETAAWQRLDVDDPSDSEQVRIAAIETLEDQKLVMIQLLVNRYDQHGDQVAEVLQKSDELLSRHPEQRSTSSVEEISISSALELDKLSEDELGNMECTFHVNPDKIAQLIASSDKRVINLSFQVGTFRMKLVTKGRRVYTPQRDLGGSVTINGVTSFHDTDDTQISAEEAAKIEQEQPSQVTELAPEDRIFRLEDGYASRWTVENIRAIVDLARKFPDKILVAAAGNPFDDLETGGTRYPDIREAKQKMREELGGLPSNLMWIGVYSEKHERLFSRGADYYVSSKTLSEMTESDSASSFATPFVSRTIDKLIAKGCKTVAEIKAKLCEASFTFDNPTEQGTDHSNLVLSGMALREQILPQFPVDLG